MDSKMTGKYPNNWANVILLGDSLTEHAFDDDANWGGKLQSLLKRKAHVLNYGFSGYTTATLKLVLPKIFDPQFFKNVACLILCIGANDSWFQTQSKFNPGITVDQYKANLIEILRFLLDNGLSKDKIIMVTPPTINTEKWKEFCDLMRESRDLMVEKTPEHTKLYVETMLEIGNEFNVKTFDLFEITKNPANFDRAFVDGLHFSNYGANLIYNLIQNAVQECVRKFRNTDYENFPNFMDIDFNNLSTFFTNEPSNIKLEISRTS